MVSATGAAGDSSNHPLMKSSMLSGGGGVITVVPATGNSSNHPPTKSVPLMQSHPINCYLASAVF